MKRIDILKEAHKLLKIGYMCYASGICIAIQKVYLNNGKLIEIFDISKKFPLFTLENAKKFKAVDDTYWSYWWKPYNYGLFSGRRRFMRWLMKQYKNDKEEII